MGTENNNDLTDQIETDKETIEVFRPLRLQIGDFLMRGKFENNVSVANLIKKGSYRDDGWSGPSIYQCNKPPDYAFAEEDLVEEDGWKFHTMPLSELGLPEDELRALNILEKMQALGIRVSNLKELLTVGILFQKVCSFSPILSFHRGVVAAISGWRGNLHLSFGDPAGLYMPWAQVLVSVK
ncbi:MAG: hypothetical protein G01um101419_212 [Parcubacteria group bacterium Gr01-1014_19]|nr:MAG: hypothetical protein G01um101419_212 [Parcubacteria group bacterium Gr01-1014_19]